MYHVHIIESLPSGSWYIGYATDLNRRISEHNCHKNISTAALSNWKLIYYETYLHKMDARGREKFLKSGSGWRFLKKQLSHYMNERSKI